jgi:hypothetical protein
LHTCGKVKGKANGDPPSGTLTGSVANSNSNPSSTKVSVTIKDETHSRASRDIVAEAAGVVVAALAAIGIGL